MFSGSSGRLLQVACRRNVRTAAQFIQPALRTLSPGISRGQRSASTTPSRPTNIAGPKPIDPVSEKFKTASASG